MTSIQGKSAVVTGAARGIGRACAIALQAAGVKVIGLDFLPSQDDGLEVLSCNLAIEDDIKEAISKVAKILGSIDIVVNNAGIVENRSLADVDAEHLDRMLSVNLLAPILVARESLPYIPEGGRIINIVSELAFLGRANSSVYCATKAGLVGLTRALARELAPRILVNAVAPGPTDTPMLSFENLSEAKKAAETANPLGRVGRPEEVAASVVFLAGPAATLYTGQCLGANCGAVML
ncbi:SDR family oxidoreductase [Pararhizobium sp. YC-54]|uniref:SDR family NAD(P)-dependent oxidoreductase n=1 Tax=Pararhizobium sp. YC-54 TaxID=2986920 RepID=UPI0021F6BADE|nr:SDR family oxidoreductase [Pararhizobium sp. YC-54]MCV9999373.1 SDR family oxidoreductase [Pararhizobium sp. YC-54]